MNKFYCLSFSWNWADEMDVFGCEFFTEKEYQYLSTIKDKLEKYKDSQYEVSIGTNEEIIYDGSDIISLIEDIEEISELTFNEMKSLKIDKYATFDLKQIFNCFLYEEELSEYSDDWENEEYYEKLYNLLNE